MDGETLFLGRKMRPELRTKCPKCGLFMTDIEDEDGYELGFICYHCHKEYLYE